ncbi:hypothetical protein RRG08_000210 [Elysia crispata]|uniref:VWFA domain-containing protein n=1 Tax=Elysia crispata TaxID=231223 RepID=A0AAE0YUX9_9GAST|nr:hypothetical protein RRG08_000210 [Elysia crispata]
MILCLTLALHGLLAGSCAAGETCKSDDVTADIFFLVDVSFYFRKSDLKTHVPNFVKSFMGSFIFSLEKVRVGFYSYSSSSIDDLHRFLDRQDLVEKIDSLPYIGGDPTLHKGLQIADASFKYLWGGREDAPNFLILISGGRSSHPRKTQVRITALEVSLLLTLLLCVSGGKSRYPYLTKEMLARLSKKRVTIYAIGVGASAHTKELKTIASSPSHKFYVEKAKDLSSIKSKLLMHMYETYNASVQSDVFFLLDASYMVSRFDFIEIKNFAKSFVDSFIYTPYNLRGGVFAYSERTHTVVNLKHYGYHLDLNFIFKTFRYIGGLPTLHTGLDVAKWTFSRQEGDRKTAANFVIIISSGNFANLRRSKKNLGDLSKKAVRTYFIAVGPDVIMYRVRLIRFYLRRIFHVQKAQALSSIKDELVRNICADIKRAS